jgi:hypothetical protein
MTDFLMCHKNTASKIHEIQLKTIVEINKPLKPYAGRHVTADKI